MYDIWSTWSDCFVLVYSITDPESLRHVIEAKRDIDHRRRFNPAYFILVGNKCDLLQQRRVTEREGRATADALGCAAFYEVSARDNVSVQTAFENSLNSPDSKRLSYRRNSVIGAATPAPVAPTPEKKKYFWSRSKKSASKGRSVEAPSPTIRDPLALRSITAMRRSSIPW